MVDTIHPNESSHMIYHAIELALKCRSCSIVYDNNNNNNNDMAQFMLAHSVALASFCAETMQRCRHILQPSQKCELISEFRLDLWYK